MNDKTSCIDETVSISSAPFLPRKHNRLESFQHIGRGGDGDRNFSARAGCERRTGVFTPCSDAGHSAHDGAVALDPLLRGQLEAPRTTRSDPAQGGGDMDCDLCRLHALDVLSGEVMARR